MKQVCKILIYDRQPQPDRKKQITIKDPLLEGGFTTDIGTIGWLGTSGWTTSAGSGVATFASSTQLGVLTQPFQNQLYDEYWYEVGFQLTGVTGGSIDVYLGAERLGSFSANGQHSINYLKSGSTPVGQITFKPTNKGGSDFSGSVITSSISIQQSDTLNQKGMEGGVINYYPKDYLQLKEDFTVAYNWQLTEVASLNSNRGGFTKQFTIPGTKHNRELLGLFGENNVTFTKIDIRNKIKADILIDDNTFKEGWLVVKKMVRDQGELAYECEFYDSVFNLFNVIGKKKVSDLDVSRYDHVLTADNIFSTWEPTRIWERAYTYPMLYLDAPETVYRTIDFSPAWYNKFLFNEIILGTGQYGYEISPEADATFEKLMTTPTGKRRSIDTASDGPSVFAGAFDDILFSTETVSDTTLTAVRVSDERIPFDDDYANQHYDPFDSYSNQLYVYNLTQVGIPHVFEFNIDTTITSIPSFTNWMSGDTAQIQAGQPGFFMMLDPITGLWVQVLGYIDYTSIVEVYIENPQGNIILQSLQYEFPLEASSATTVVPFVFSGSVTIDGANVIPGEYALKLKIRDVRRWLLFGDTTFEPNFSYERDVVISSDDSWYKVTPQLDAAVSDNSVMRMNKWLPVMDQKTFINEHMNLFNLYAFEGLDRKIKFITRTELYQDQYKIDWSKKIQHVYDHSPLTDVTSTQTILGYKETEDIWNDLYRDENEGVQYGDFVFDNGTDLFNETTEERSKIYGSTPMVIDQGGRIISGIHSRELPKEHRLLLQGDNLYDSPSRIWMDYFDPYASGWTFDDNYYWLEDLGLGYTEMVAFTSFTSNPHNLSLGDQIRITQNSTVDEFQPSYNGMCEVMKVIDAYGIVVNRPWAGDSSTTPGIAVTLPHRDQYRADVHIDSLSASTIDINYGVLARTLLPADLGITPNNLGQKYYRQQLVQNKEGELYTCAADLSFLDVKEVLDHIGASIWVNSLNSYFKIYSISDFDPVTAGLTKIQLLKVVSDYEFAFSRKEITTIPNGVGTDGGSGGAIGLLSTNNFSMGSGNNFYGNNNTFVAGNNNSLSTNVKNTFVLGNNIFARTSNSVYLGNWVYMNSNFSTFYGSTVFNSSGMSSTNIYVRNDIVVGGDTGTTITSTGITIGGVLITSATTDHTKVQPGLNTYTAGTESRPSVNVVASPVFTSVSATTFFSGTTNLNSLLAGRYSHPYKEIGAHYGINGQVDDTIGVNAKAGPVIVLLPLSSTIPNWQYTIKDISAFAGTNFITISARTSDSIYDFVTATTKTLITTNGGSLTFQNSGTGKWLVI